MGLIVEWFPGVLQTKKYVGIVQAYLWDGRETLAVVLHDNRLLVVPVVYLNVKGNTDAK